MDALLPPEMAIKAEDLGARKVALPPATTLVLAILAGAFIAVGGALSTTVSAGAGQLPYGVGRLLTGAAFSLGLIAVSVGGAELFTGNNLMVMALMSGKVTRRQLARSWLLVYTGNLVGAVATAGLMVAGGHHGMGDGAVGSALIALAVAKSKLGFVQALVLGVLANALVCLAVWLSYSARSTTDRVIALVPPITAFVACGFEHSVANMYFFPAALLARAVGFVPEAPALARELGALDVWELIYGNLLPVTAGNILGGTLLVGAAYWFVYLRQRRP